MKIQELYTDASGVSLMWIGNNGWVINLFGVIVCTDPDLYSFDRVPIPTDVDLNEMAQSIQVVLITHEHGDHFNEKTCLFLQDNSDCLFLMPSSCEERIAEIGLDKKRIIITTPGVDISLAELEIQVKPIRAIHGHLMGSVYEGANLQDCGYIVSRKGFSFYQPGDTVVLHEHFDMKGIDLLFFSPTEHNMQIENSIRFIRLIKPNYIFPQHYASYITTRENSFWTKGYTDEVYEKLCDEEQKKFVKIPQGHPYVIKL